MEKGEIAPVPPVEKIHKELPGSISEEEKRKKRREEENFGEILEEIEKRDKEKEEKKEKDK